MSQIDRCNRSKQSFRGRIKPGALILWDFKVGRWPIHNYLEDMTFTMTLTQDGFRCVAPGFGLSGSGYGSGAVYVYNEKV